VAAAAAETHYWSACSSQQPAVAMQAGAAQLAPPITCMRMQTGIHQQHCRPAYMYSQSTGYVCQQRHVLVLLHAALRSHLMHGLHAYQPRFHYAAPRWWRVIHQVVALNAVLSVHRLSHTCCVCCCTHFSAATTAITHYCVSYTSMHCCTWCCTCTVHCAGTTTCQRWREEEPAPSDAADAYVITHCYVVMFGWKLQQQHRQLCRCGTCGCCCSTLCARSLLRKLSCLVSMNCM
jgi:hypothetical protein